MRVVVTGATGNIGTNVVRELADRPEVGSVVGLARRLPPPDADAPDKTSYVAVDVTDGDLEAVFRGATRSCTWPG